MNRTYLLHASATLLLGAAMLAAGCTPPPAAPPSTQPSTKAPAASGAPAQSGAPGLIKAHGKITEIAPDMTRFTIAHGDIPEIPMKAMTMPYKVSDAAVLQGLKPDQEVDFFIDNSKGELVVVRITPGK